MDDEEAYENAYFYFVHALELLQLRAEQQCERQSYFNVAWETKDDVSAGLYLLNCKSCTLSPAQKESITAVIRSLDDIPSELLGFTDDPDESLKRMRHPAWAPLRKQAERLLELLQPTTVANKKYFENKSREPFMRTAAEVALYLQHALSGTLLRDDWKTFLRTPMPGAPRMDAIRAECGLLEKFRATGSGTSVALTEGARRKIEDLLTGLAPEL